jgi:hypothetical protein
MLKDSFLHCAVDANHAYEHLVKLEIAIQIAGSVQTVADMQVGRTARALAVTVV